MTKMTKPTIPQAAIDEAQAAHYEQHERIMKIQADYENGGMDDYMFHQGFACALELASQNLREAVTAAAPHILHADIEAHEAGKWQPIESAPFQTLILVNGFKSYEGHFHYGYKGEQPVVVYFVNDGNTGKTCIEIGGKMAYFDDLSHPPTHWQPLPQPPKENV